MKRSRLVTLAVLCTLLVILATAGLGVKLHVERSWHEEFGAVPVGMEEERVVWGWSGGLPHARVHVVFMRGRLSHYSGVFSCMAWCWKRMSWEPCYDNTFRELSA